jgi:RNA polymerase sigma-70 factor (ECF subfamily)
MLALAADVISIQRNSPSDDAALAARGDRNAYERLYRANVGRIFSLCTRMAGSRERAEELTQDVFVRAWEKLPQFRGDSLFSTWLHRLAVNVVLNARKSDGRQRARHHEDEDDDMDAFATPRQASPGDRMDLEAAIASLPPGARRVFVLHDVEGFKHEEIAEQLGVTAGGSKAQLHRARMLLREALTR